MVSKEEKGKHATRKDVAKAAGVSLTTVTHSLSPVAGSRIGLATRERVKEVARRLGYRPSYVGTALVSGKTSTVGLLQPGHESIYYPLYQDIIAGLVQAMEPEDYHPLILFRSPERGYLKVIAQGRIDGMIILQSDVEASHIHDVMATGLPTVVVNKVFDPGGVKTAGCVHADHAAMAESVVEELTAAGCRMLLEVIDPAGADANACVHEAFVAAAEARASRGVVSTTLRPSVDRFAMQVRNSLAAGARWDGVFTDGAEVAEVLVEESSRAGWRPGRDFELVTSDTRDGRLSRGRDERAGYTQQPAFVGRESWRLLSALMRGEDIEQVIRVPYGRHAGRTKPEAKT